MSHLIPLTAVHTLNAERRIITGDGVKAKLSPAHAHALEVMADRRGRVVPHADLLLSNLRRRSDDKLNARALMSRLRERLSEAIPGADSWIETVMGRGYVFVGAEK